MLQDQVSGPLPTGGSVIEAGLTPVEVAERFVMETCKVGEQRGLHWWWNGFWQWRNEQWTCCEPRDVEDAVWLWTRTKKWMVPGPDGSWTYRPMKVDQRDVSDIVRATEALVKIREDRLPLRMGGARPVWYGNLVGFEDQVVDVATGQTWDRGPEWFDPVVLPGHWHLMEGREDEELCPIWLSFLEQISGGDEKWIETLGRFMGLCLTPETKFSVWMLAYGKPRAGKGTMLRVLEKLLGSGNYLSMGLDDLGSEFGLMQLRACRLLMLPDVDGRVSRERMGKAVSNLKSMVGQDRIMANVKHRAHQMNVRATAKVLMVSNEIPQLKDEAKALSSKMLLLPFNVSFLGKEDRELEDKLVAELPGIAVWAVRAAMRLWADGQWPRLEDAEEDRLEFAAVNNPLGAYLDEKCEADPKGVVSSDGLYRGYEAWCREVGIEPMGSSWFGIRLRKQPGWTIEKVRTGSGKGREWAYRGLKYRG